MRTIKFRGKKEKTGEWVNGFFAYLHIPDMSDSGQITEGFHAIPSIFNDEPGNRNRTYWDTVDQKTVGQFSGAFDCEGREIYEGDILSACYGHSPNITEVTGVVEFVHCGFALKFGKDAGVWLDQLIHAEIIGNIHDTPELLKGGAQ